MHFIPCAGAAITGIVSHLGYFIRGEHHRSGSKLILFYSLLYVLLVVMFQKGLEIDLGDSISMASLVSISYFLGLFASMLAYRAFFHPLRKFPGPSMAKLSNLYHCSRLSNLDNYKVVDRMHREYGDIVRTGPSNLSVITPEAVALVLGPESKCTKAPWYDQGLPVVSMHTTRSRRAHDHRRRIWSKGFSPAALRGYEGRVVMYTRELVSQLSAFSGRPVNVSKWFNFYSFDVMGDLAFGESFNMLKSGETHWALKLLNDGMIPLGALLPLPWALPVLARIPGVAKGYHRFLAFCRGQADKRSRMRVETPDIMSWLLEAHEKSNKGDEEMQFLYGDSRLIIVAGSDTTAATLTHLFYHLAKEPAQVQKLREELMPLLKGNETLDVKDVSAAKHLDACINETLRLHPPVPSGVPRLTPPEGITVNGTFIPGNATLLIPFFSLGRSDEIYAHPNEFIPERWYSSPELIKHKDAFAPFSLGRYSCIGKQLAIMEIRTVVTLIIQEFDVRLAPGEDGKSLLEDTMDYFTLGLGDLNLVFERRTVG